MKPLSYTIAHLEIDGEIIDRDRGYPELELAMEPMGRALTPDQQSCRLRVRIGNKETVIGAEGVDYLYQWLGVHGARRRIEVDEMEAPTEPPPAPAGYLNHRFQGVAGNDEPCMHCGLALRAEIHLTDAI